MIDLIRDRLTAYNCTNQIEEEQGLREIIQEIALYGLWRSGFFEVGALQGGTSLRILHGVNRFSEDLDFILKTADKEFSWARYLGGMTNCFEEFGVRPEILDKSRMEKRIRKALIKDSSIANQLNLSFFRGDSRRRQKIKLEIDIDPPENSNFEYSYLNFPLDFEVCHQDLSSNFSLKIHSLLCRPYVKGRDWFDFNWYVNKGVGVNYPHLQSALNQWGPWAGTDPSVDTAWVKTALAEKIAKIDWKEAVIDVEPFLPLSDQHGLKLWGERFFMDKVDKFREQD